MGKAIFERRTVDGKLFYQTARHHAVSRLIREYFREYQQYYQEEKGKSSNLLNGTKKRLTEVNSEKYRQYYLEEKDKLLQEMNNDNS